MSINTVVNTGTRNGKRDISPVYSLPQTNTLTPYVRPADWLTMPTVLSTDQTVVLLVAVENCTTNFFAVTATTSAGTYTVNWGDGTADSVVASGSNAYHNFDWNNVSSGTLTTRGYRQAIVTITPTSANLLTCTFLANYVDSSVVTPNIGWNNKILESIIAGSNLTGSTMFSSTGSQVTAWMEQTTVLSLSSTANLSGMFRGCRTLQNVVSFPNGSYTNVPFMFDSCISLEVAPNFTFAATSMAFMFSNCFRLQSVPLYNTAAVTDMEGMFQSCFALTTVPFFDTGNVTNMPNMFNACQALTSVPPFNTGNVLSMASMFAGCNTLKTVPTFNTVKVTTISGMFTNCINLITAPPLNLIACTSTASMYSGCFALESAPAYNLPVCTNIGSMYINCYSLKSIGTMTTSGLLTSMSQVFTQCRSLLAAPIITNTTNVVNMAELFYSCYAITDIPVYDTANVTTMNGMFGFTYSLKTAPAINTIKATNFQSMFQASGIINAPSYNTSNVTAMNTAFYQARSLASVPVYDTSKVITMQAMFQDTSSLIEIPALNTSNVTSFAQFASSSGVRRVAALDTVKATSIVQMFSGCTNLVTIPTTMNFTNVASATFGAFNNNPGLSIAPSNNLKISTSYQNCLFGETELENIFTGLGTVATSQTVTISGNPGAGAAVTKTGSTVNSGINIITIANTVGLVAGMTMGAFTNVNSNIAATFPSGGNSTVRLPMVLSDNTLISFSSVSTSNVLTNTYYYTQYFSGSAPTVEYKLRLTPAGSNVNLSSGTGVARIDTKIVSISTPNVFVNYNFTNSAANSSVTFRSIDTNLATFKNWAISG